MWDQCYFNLVDAPATSNKAMEYFIATEFLTQFVDLQSHSWLSQTHKRTGEQTQLFAFPSVPSRLCQSSRGSDGERRGGGGGRTGPASPWDRRDVQGQGGRGAAEKPFLRLGHRDRYSRACWPLPPRTYLMAFCIGGGKSVWTRSFGSVASPLVPGLEWILDWI